MPPHVRSTELLYGSNALRAAKKLRDTAQQQTTDIQYKEALLRACVSRAYYAAFIHARTYAVLHFGYIKQGAKDHHDVAREFYRNNRSEWNDLKTMHEHRKLCDYAENINLVDLMAMANNCIIDAENIITTFIISPP